MFTATLDPDQVKGLVQAYEDIESLKQQVKVLTERLAEIEKSSQLDQNK